MVDCELAEAEPHATLVQRGKGTPRPYASDLLQSENSSGLGKTQLQLFLDLALGREAGGLLRLAWVVLASYMGEITSMKC